MAEQTPVNGIADLSALLKIPAKVLNELSTKMSLCIGSAISEAKIANDQTVLIDIGVGVLSISIATMQCKFIPSKELKKAIKKALTEKIDPLELELEKTLAEKLIALCKEEL